MCMEKECVSVAYEPPVVEVLLVEVEGGFEFSVPGWG